MHASLSLGCTARAAAAPAIPQTGAHLCKHAEQARHTGRQAAGRGAATRTTGRGAVPRTMAVPTKNNGTRRAPTAHLGQLHEHGHDALAAEPLATPKGHQRLWWRAGREGRRGGGGGGGRRVRAWQCVPAAAAPLPARCRGPFPSIAQCCRHGDAALALPARSYRQQHITPPPWPSGRALH